MTDGPSNDDSLKQRLPGSGDFNPASDIERGPLAKKCVGRIWHDVGPGSGLLLPGNWFLTNHHVLPTPEKARDAVAQFDYERRPDGKFSPMTQFHFDPDAGFHTSPVTDGDDWTVVKLKGDANAEFGSIPIEDVAPRLNETVHIIQHPEAQGSIFDVGRVIEVSDLSAGELQKLAVLYKLPGLDVKKLLLFLGGHPALSQRALVHMQEDDLSLDEVIADADKGGVFKQHLDRLTKDFRTLPDAKRLANSFRGLVNGKPLDSEETFDALLALGVVKGTYSGDVALVVFAAARRLQWRTDSHR